MAALGDTTRNALLNHVLRNQAYTPATTVYLALYTSDPSSADTGTEVTGGSYARQSIAFGAASGGSVSNTGAITFSNMPATTVTHAALRDASTAGTLLFFGPLASAITTSASDNVVFSVGQIIAQML